MARGRVRQPAVCRIVEVLDDGRLVVEADDLKQCLARLIGGGAGRLALIPQKLPSSGFASTTATLSPAFWRYVAAGNPPEMPPPTTTTS